MDIRNKGSITLPGELTSSGPLRALKPGSRISARILDRLGNSRALIEIAGRRVQAEFTGGIPPEVRITLLLKGENAGSLVFSLLKSDSRETLLVRLQQLTLLGRDAESIRAFHAAGSSLDKGLRSVFDTNILLLSSGGAIGRKQANIAEILNKMASLGVSKEILGVFSYLFSRIGGINLNYFTPFFRLLGIDIRFKDARDRDREAEAALKTLADELKGIPRERGEEGYSIVSELLYAMARADTPGLSGARMGVIPYQEEGEFRQLRYLADETAFMVAIELSSLGRVEILAREIEGRVIISVFCESEAAFRALEGDLKALERELSGNIQRGITVGLYNGARAVQNIIEIYTSLMLDSVVDIKA